MHLTDRLTERSEEQGLRSEKTKKEIEERRIEKQVILISRSRPSSILLVFSLLTPCSSLLAPQFPRSSILCRLST
jgi:hypothetical protein